MNLSYLNNFVFFPQKCWSLEPLSNLNPILCLSAQWKISTPARFVPPHSLQLNENNRLIMLLIAVPLVHLMDGNPPDGSVMDDIHASSFQCAFPIQLFLLVVVFFFFFSLTLDFLQIIHCLFKKIIG